MPLGGHLDELRRCVIASLLGLIPIAVLAFIYGGELLDLIIAPARKALHEGGQSDPVAIGPLEIFSAYMRVSILAAIVVGSPWILYQVWRFVSPGLYKHEKRFVYFLLPLSAILTASGVVFLFKVVLPLILGFLISFGMGIHRPTVATAPLPAGVTLPSIPVLAADPPAEVIQPGNYWINTDLKKLRIAMPVQPGMMDDFLGINQLLGAGSEQGAAAPQTAPAQASEQAAQPAEQSIGQPRSQPASEVAGSEPSTPTPPTTATTSATPAPRVAVEVWSGALYRETGILQQYRISEVLSMMLTLILAFAGAFQAPLIVLLLGWAGLVDRAFLRTYRRHAMLACAIIAAAVMPGDPASMLAMALPLYLLYELGGILLWLFPARRIRGKVETAPGETSEDEDDRP